jgi:hypothetical protein
MDMNNTAKVMALLQMRPITQKDFPDLKLIELCRDLGATRQRIYVTGNGKKTHYYNQWSL